MEKITIDQALDKLEDGMTIVTGLGISEAQGILSNIHRVSNRINNLTIINCLYMLSYPFFEEEYSDKFTIKTWFYEPELVKRHPQGNIGFLPNNLHFAGSKLLDAHDVNVYIGTCSSIDKHGNISLSMGNTYEREMIDAADFVILESNPNFPRTFGDVTLRAEDVDFIIETDYKLPELPDVEPNEKDEIIGKLIAERIEDGDVIQLGIGGIPNAVARQLYEKKDLGVHTEMLTSEMAKLAKAGVITGNKKNFHRGKMVTTFIMGDKELYEFVDDNPMVEVLRGSYVNDPDIIAKNDNQVSINTALEVDLTGQCSSESIGSVQISGTGGQADTVRGSQKSKGGRSFIALYSTYMARVPGSDQRVEKSKIVSQLAPGAIVSLQRNDVQFIVTEYGVANLKGKSVPERVEEMIKIAHPNFREQLKEEAKKYKIVGENYDFSI